MDHPLLRSWLGLAPGAWPPDHYELLGLASGSCDPDEVERLVLDHMARLRPHQLLHPELVTEGMNRLAQALVCLTDPAARAAYDAELGLPPVVPVAEPPRVPPRTLPPPLPPSPPPYEVIPGFPISSEEETPASDLTQVIELPFIAGLTPPEALTLPYEVVEEEAPRPAPYEVVPEPVIEAELLPSAPPPWQPATRRQLYARLTALRRLIEGWQKLQPLLGDPQEPFDRPIKVLLLMEAVEELRPLLNSIPGLLGHPSRPGGLVAVLLRQRLFLHSLRSLLPDQRRAVAIDCRHGEEALRQEYARLREISRSSRPYRRRFPRRRRRLFKAIAWAIRNPESLLILLAYLVILAALVRWSRGH